MVIAISLQKMDTQYAGLADSYYLAALKYLPPVMRPMDLKTLQAFALLAEYSLLTPTRTAIYYVMGLAVRLAQALGINEEKTITRAKDGSKADFLEIDMRRRLFWCIWVMELGLAHSLGRPSVLATSREHIDVAFFEAVADEYITPEGILPGATRPSLKKWIAIHFFKMRLLQLEIRRKLYLKKRLHPKNDKDPWFQQMHAKLESWRDASPNNDEGSGLNKIWFIGRYNTMIVMLWRPSPQVPRPSLDAALRCFEACKCNIILQREQITLRTIDMTWIFTQSIFMAINTLLWTLSYAEVRRRNAREDVERYLSTAMDAIGLCSARWPGVTSAIQLYEDLIQAILKIYDKDGDVQVNEVTPSDTTSPQANSEPINRSRTTSPATVSTSSIATPPERLPSLGYFQSSSLAVEQPPPMPYRASATPPPQLYGHSPQPPSSGHNSQSRQYSNSPAAYPIASASQQHSHNPSITYDPQSQFSHLPSFSNTLQGWNTAYMAPQQSSPFASYNSSPANRHAMPVHAYPMQSSAQHFFAGMDPTNYPQDEPDVLNPTVWGQEMIQFGNGLDHAQQTELMLSLETSGMEDIQHMITPLDRLWNPQPHYGT